MDDQEFSAKELEALAAWQAAEPPADFAERVLAARTERKASARHPDLRMLWLSSGALIAAAAALWLMFTGQASQGMLEARARETQAIGERAVAVAEAGAVLRWRVERSGEARVEQREGSVFYRVEHGGPFRVTTPLGSVEVLGTCFRVEVMPMKWSKEHLVSSAVAAAATAAVVVTVYEGRVNVANAAGAQVVIAGQEAYAGKGEKVRVSEAGGAHSAVLSQADEPSTPEAFKGYVQTLRQELIKERLAHARVQKEAEDLRANLARAEAGEGPIKEAPDFNDGYFQPSPEELRERLKECTLKIDLPPVLGSEPSKLGEDNLHGLSLSPEERVAMNSAIAALHKRFRKQIQALYVEATGDETGARALSPATMLRELTEKSPDGSSWAVRRQLLLEQLGEATPPGDLTHASPVERAWRIMAALGDDFEEALSESLGSERAHELRAMQDGWPFSRWSEGGCGGGPH